MIAGHIPPSHNWCDQDWSERYNLIVERFRDTIKGQFYGHTHKDHLTVQRMDSISRKEDKLVSSALFVVPSLTTSSNQRPSYRLYIAHSSTHDLLDYHQYRMN